MTLEEAIQSGECFKIQGNIATYRWNKDNQTMELYHLGAWCASHARISAFVNLIPCNPPEIWNECSGDQVRSLLSSGKRVKMDIGGTVYNLTLRFNSIMVDCGDTARYLEEAFRAAHILEAKFEYLEVQ